MLLVFDVGNTKTAIGLHDGDAWVRDWRISTQAERLADETAALLDSLLAGVGVSRQDIDGLAAASVVPSATEILRNLAERHFGSRLFVLNHKTARGIRLAVDTPEETGPDRIANTVAVPSPLRSGRHRPGRRHGADVRRDLPGRGIPGRAIAPGLGVSAEALVRRTARLPRVELRLPKRVVGTHTVAAMQSGLVHGWTGMVREMVRLLKEELGGNHTVIATGGLAHQVAEWTGVVDLVNERLTLEGIRIVHSRQPS